MNKSLIALAILSTAGISFAAPTVYEPFNYPVAATGPSNLSTQSGGVWNAVLSGAATEPQVVSGNLSYTGLPASSGNHVQIQNSSSGSSRLNLAAVASGTLYYSMIFQGSDATNENAADGGSFLAGFNNSQGTGTSITSGGATLVIRQDNTDSSKFDLGIGISSGASTRVWAPTGYSASDTLFLVGSYTFNPGTNDDVANLYIFNGSTIPASMPATPDATSTGSDIATGQIQSFFLRDNSIEPSTMDVDELRIGTTWADVTGVPEPASLGLLGMGALGLLARRRRTA